MPDNMINRALSLSMKLFFMLAVFISLLLTSCTTPESALADKKAYTEDDPAYKKKFAVELDTLEKPIRYGYHYIVSTIPEGYRVRVFHPDKKVLTEVETYSTENLTMLHGPYESYWDDGSIREQGIYQFGKKHGTWVESQPGRGKSSSGLYDTERKEGEWTQLDTNGLVESIYTWHDNQLHGKFFLYDSSGKKINEGIYQNDSVVGSLYKMPVITKPYLKNCQPVQGVDLNECTMASLANTFKTNIKYPSVAKDKKIEGIAVIQWDVMPDGTVAHVRVPQSLSDQIEKECLRVFKMIGKWVPAYKDGQPIKYTMSLPIDFRLPK
jgi:TonB family protein